LSDELGAENVFAAGCLKIGEHVLREEDSTERVVDRIRLRARPENSLGATQKGLVKVVALALHAHAYASTTTAGI
jgi:hypothetical protein